MYLVPQQLHMQMTNLIIQMRSYESFFKNRKAESFIFFCYGQHSWRESVEFYRPFNVKLAVIQLISMITSIRDLAS